MSLTNKPVDQITFADVEAFCLQQQPEGPRLDYKSEFNNDHAKLICAFANTLGGTIVLGIEGNSSNQPVWPPKGLVNTNGLEDRIINVARDAIYPPIRPRISRLLTDAGSGKSVMVVQVDESPEAPHAVETRTKVYVYERTGSNSKPWALADVDRISYLLNRRKRVEQDRESAIDKAIARAKKHLNAPRTALRWASIIPLYPWRRLCDPELCYFLHFGFLQFGRLPGHVQRFPDGSFAVVELPDTRIVESMTAHGHIFVMEYPSEKNPVFTQNEVEPHNFLDFRKTIELANKIQFQFAKEFFGHPAVELPGFLQFDLGFLNVFDKQMMNEQRETGRPFPDDEFRTQVVFAVEDLINHNDANDKMLFHQIKHGFDLFEDRPRWRN